MEIEQLAHQTPFWLALLSTGIIALLFEEAIFRLLIQDVIFDRSVLGILTASLIFALLHLVAGFSMSALLVHFGASDVIGTLYNFKGWHSVYGLDAYDR